MLVGPKEKCLSLLLSAERVHFLSLPILELRFTLVNY